MCEVFNRFRAVIMKTGVCLTAGCDLAFRIVRNPTRKDTYEVNKSTFNGKSSNRAITSTSGAFGKVIWG